MKFSGNGTNNWIFNVYQQKVKKTDVRKTKAPLDNPIYLYSGFVIPDAAYAGCWGWAAPFY